MILIIELDRFIKKAKPNVPKPKNQFFNYRIFCFCFLLGYLIVLKCIYLW